jgi:Mrp family chromosome partitioning ATPase
MALGGEEIKENLQDKSVLIVMSGKGGVGKSTFAAGIACLLSRQGDSCIVDCDAEGPSMERITGCGNTNRINGRIVPHRVAERVGVLSPSHSSGSKSEVISDLLLSHLEGYQNIVIDTPPGSTDEHITLSKYISSPRAIVLSTPHALSVCDVARQVDFCRKSGIEVIGIVENMKHFECTRCGSENSLFTGESLQEKCREMGINYLGSIPYKRSVAMAGDKGVLTEEAVPEELFKRIKGLLNFSDGGAGEKGGHVH